MRSYGAGLPSMTEAERRRIGDFVEGEFGIKMPAAKKSLLEGRLGKRLLACGLPSYGAYFEFVTQSPQGRDEYLHFLDLVSTHETSFFREPRHFHYLEDRLLPSLCAERGRRSISVLCAACSTGEEAYTIAMLADAALEEGDRGDIELLAEGIDLSHKAVSVAARGVYLAERAAKIQGELRRRYLMESRDRSKGLCRFVPELRAKLSFHTGNLLGDLALERRSYDIVFCRNVLIYFDRSNQRKVIARLVDAMVSGSFLFLGHSETMLTFDFPLRSVAHSVYQRR